MVFKREDLLIKKCGGEDLFAVGAVYDKATAYLDATVNYPKWTHKEYPSVEYAAEMMKSGSQYVVYFGNKAVAAFVLNEDPAGNYAKAEWKSGIKEGEYLVIHALAVDHEYYGRKIASLIVRYCLEEAKKQGYKAIRLDVVPENEPAKKLYRSLGFKYFGDCDLERDLDIKYFSMFEYVF